MSLQEIPGQERELVRLHGPDAHRFLQGTVSADIEPVGRGRAVPSALLTVKGKLVSELIVVPGSAPEELGLLVPADVTPAVVELLDKHIIMDEVEVEHRARPGLGLLWDPDGGEVSVLEADTVTSLPTRHPAPGLLMIGAADDVIAAVASTGATQADAETFTRWRVQTGSPAWGREIEAGRFPPEVGFVYAVSYDKGCYMGQEPLARIHARGQVNRVMVRVRADRMPPDVVGLSHPDRAEAGVWTTFVEDDAAVTGLAIVRRELASPGTRLQTRSESEAIDVEVTSAPLGDDPGARGRSGGTATVKLR